MSEIDRVTQDEAFQALVEGTSVPRPEPREKQYEFLGRCIAVVKANNGTLADDEAAAMCLTSWQSRYESSAQGEVTQSDVAFAALRGNFGDRVAQVDASRALVDVTPLQGDALDALANPDPEVTGVTSGQVTEDDAFKALKEG